MPESIFRTLQQHWKPAALVGRVAPNGLVRDWLTTQGSLTRRIRSHCPDMQVTVLSEAWERPLVCEAHALKRSLSEKAWVRCVLLQCGERNWVYARTVIPDMQAGNPWRSLQTLGNQPLGEVLFELKNLQRSGFEFSRQFLEAWPGLSQAIELTERMPNTTWARRSRFVQKKAPLLLTEVFLPDLTGS